MSSLTQRAEQGLIGAALAAGQPIKHLSADDFAHPGYRAIYDALTHIWRDQPLLTGPDLHSAVAARTDTPGLGQPELADLQQHAPPPGHVAAYTRMVTTESFRRQIATHAERITHTTTGPDTGPHLERLSQALSRQATLHAQMRQTQDRPVEAAAAPKPDARATREDRVLAALLQYPEQAQTLASVLPPESFTDPQRREVYETAVSLASSGDPIDGAIVAWELDRTRYIQRLTAGDRPHIDYTEPDATYLTRLAAIPVSADTAIRTAQKLLTDDIHNGLKTRTLAKDLTVSPSPVPQTLTGIVIDPKHRPAPPPLPEPGIQAPRINGHGGAR